MATVSARILRISSQRLGTQDAEDLVRAVESADEVVFDLDRSFRADALKIVMLICAATRRERQITLQFGGVAPSAGLRESLDRSLVTAFLPQPENTLTTGSFASGEIAARSTPYVDRGRHLLCISTSDLDCKTRDGFYSDLAKWAVAAGIGVHTSIMRRVAMLAYEPNANAEEHGSVRLTDAKSFDAKPVFRCFAAILSDEPGTPLPPSAAAYQERYQRSHEARTRWLQIIVADAGMGLAFPAFLLRAQAMNSSCKDVYEADYDAERAQLEEILTKGVSTKGFWGNQLSGSGAVGQGMTLIKRNVARLGGFASVRAGRCQATVSYTGPAFDEAAVKSISYEVDRAERPVFRGTLWHLLIPLDQQLQMNL